MRLRTFREAAGLTQLQLAERSGIHQTKISRIETGQVRRLTVESMRRLAQAVGVSIDEIAQPEPDTTDTAPEVRA